MLLTSTIYCVINRYVSSGTYNNDPEGKAILKNLGIEKFVIVPKKEYDIIKNIKSFVDKNVKNTNNKIF